MAVLGLLVQHSDTVGGLSLRLEGQHPNARWPRNIVHNTLTSHVRKDLVRVVGSGGAAERYEATPAGVEHFREWLRKSAATVPTLRDALRAKLSYIEDEEQLAGAIRDIRKQEEWCVDEAETAQGRYRRAWRLGRLQSSGKHDVRTRVRRVLMVDEVKLWLERAAALRRLRVSLEDPDGENDTLAAGDD